MASQSLTGNTGRKVGEGGDTPRMGHQCVAGHPKQDLNPRRAKERDPAKTAAPSLNFKTTSSLGPPFNKQQTPYGTQNRSQLKAQVSMLKPIRDTQPLPDKQTSSVAIGGPPVHPKSPEAILGVEAGGQIKLKATAFDSFIKHKHAQKGYEPRPSYLHLIHIIRVRMKGTATQTLQNLRRNNALTHLFTGHRGSARISESVNTRGMLHTTQEHCSSSKDECTGSMKRLCGLMAPALRVRGFEWVVHLHMYPCTSERQTNEVPDPEEGGAERAVCLPSHFGPPDGSCASAVTQQLLRFASTVKFEHDIGKICEHEENIQTPRSRIHKLDLNLHQNKKDRQSQAPASPLLHGLNVAAQVLSDLLKRYHVSPLLISPHWLPIAVRIKFKTLHQWMCSLISTRADQSPHPNQTATLLRICLLGGPTHKRSKSKHSKVLTSGSDAVKRPSPLTQRLDVPFVSIAINPPWYKPPALCHWVRLQLPMTPAWDKQFQMVSVLPSRQGSQQSEPDPRITGCKAGEDIMERT
ncbi:hypothetical protein Z043_113932, partial [Scleropages formosus]